MSHWAEIDKDSKVIRVLVGDNNDPNGDEGYQWLIDNLGGRWIKCSYNASIRNKYPSIGDSYLEELDVFIEQQPFPSWIFNSKTLNYEAPVAYPEDGKRYGWDEELGEWHEASTQSISDPA
jgi:hypothetical protein